MNFRINTRAGIVKHETADITIESSSGNSIAFDGSGNLGIGTSNPDGTLHVHSASAGSVTAHADANDFIVENSGNGGISILGPDNVWQSIAFGSPTDNVGALVQWTHDTGELEIGSHRTGGELALYSGNFVEAARFDSSGQLGIGTGGPEGKLHVHSGSAGSVTANTGANTLVVESNGNGGISILGPDNVNQRIMFGSPSDNFGALIQWTHLGNELAIGTVKGGAELKFYTGNFSLAARFDSSGNFITNNPVVLPTFTVATAPTATAGAIAYFSNGAAGSPVLAFGNGTNWLRSDTLATITAS